MPGAVNLLNVVLPAITSYTATNVPPGTYYTRVRAIDASGESSPSNEVIVSVGSNVCSSPPQAPTLAPATVTLNIVALSWTPGATGCPPTSYVLVAGTAPGLANVAAINTPATVLSAFAPNGTYFVRVRGINPFGIGPVSNEIVVAVGSVTPPTPPGPSPVTFGPGQWRVGSQIPAGRYFSAPSNGCYWERQRGLSGSINDVIANEFVGFNAQQWIVDILPSDLAFETDSDCGTWSTNSRPAPTGIPGGVWLVGAQIPPGTYTTNARSGCYWERLRAFTGTLAAIIDNEFVSSGGPQLVSIASTDVGFSSNADCGTWTRIAAARSTPTEDDIVSQWLAYYQTRTSNEPRPLVKR